MTFAGIQQNQGSQKKSAGSGEEKVDENLLKRMLHL